MKIFNRNISIYNKRILEFPKFIWYFIKCFILFKKPLQFLWAYFFLTPLPDHLVELRNGLKIYLSEHKHDIITIFVIFVREDYGKIPSDSRIIDIGANIGVFSLYAARNGACRIFAYEPNSESFQRLLQNIQANRLENVIAPFQLAVTDRNGENVKFPKKSSAYNSILGADDASDFEMIETINLATITENIERVDLLKIDCEGSEYDILLKSGKGVFDKMQNIRMEYHYGRENEIESFLRQFGFKKTRHDKNSDTTGNLWYEKIDIN
jgi:FkbM family methyltransferase